MLTTFEPDGHPLGRRYNFGLSCRCIWALGSDYYYSLFKISHQKIKFAANNGLVAYNSGRSTGFVSSQAAGAGGEGDTPESGRRVNEWRRRRMNTRSWAREAQGAHSTNLELDLVRYPLRFQSDKISIWLSSLTPKWWCSGRYPRFCHRPVTQRLQFIGLFIEILNEFIIPLGKESRTNVKQMISKIECSTA